MRIALLALVVACSSTPAPKPVPAPTPVVAAKPPPPPDPFAAQNLGFEDVEGDQPKGGTVKNGAAATVTDEKHGGARALRLEGERYASTRLPAKPFAGKRITVRGFIKTKDATFAALWVRVDAASGVLV